MWTRWKRPDPKDALIVAGLALLTVGLWWLAPWVALSVLGALLLSLGLWGSLR